MAMASCWRTIRLPMPDRICSAEIMETIINKPDTGRQKMRRAFGIILVLLGILMVTRVIE